MEKLIYLASPYSHPNKEVMEERFKKVTYVSGMLMRTGTVNFSPITQSHEQCKLVNLPTDWDFWQTADEAILNVCDELWILCIPGWKESLGVQAETKYAKAQKKPVHYVQIDSDTGSVFILKEEDAYGRF